MSNEILITDTDLKKSSVNYRKDLLIMPVIAAEATLQHMTPRPGVGGREVLGQFEGDAELGPYDPKRYDDSGLSIKPRTLETFLGSVIKRFDLNSVAKTVYGSLTTQGEALTSLELAQQVLNYLSMQLGRKLNMAIFSAKRNDAGTKTSELFDGFDTITTAEIAAGNIASGNGNYLEAPKAIDQTNAVDTLMGIYESASDELQGVPTKMFVPFGVYRAYNRDYLSTFGSVSYNTEYKKTFLEGSDNLCEIVPLVSKKGSPYIHLTTQSNMVYGYGDGLAQEKVEIEKHHEFLLSYVSTMFFGCQFETLSKERFMVTKLAGDTAAAGSDEGEKTLSSDENGEAQGA